MGEFGRSFGNYPPGVTGNEDYFTGRYSCEVKSCGERVGDGEFYVEDSTGNHRFYVCGNCEEIMAVCEGCGALGYADDMSRVEDEGTRHMIYQCGTCAAEMADEEEE